MASQTLTSTTITTEKTVVASDVVAALAQANTGDIINLVQADIDLSNTELSQKTGVKIVGNNATFKKAKSYGWQFIANQKNNFTLQNIKSDLNNIPEAGGFLLNGSNNLKVKNCEWKNGGNNGYMLNVGVNDGLLDTFIGDGLEVDTCVFDTHVGSKEMLNIFNQKNSKVLKSQFKNKPVGPALGLWQKADNTLIDQCTFTNCGQPIYYSITCDNINIKRSQLYNCGGIGGANISDNGIFGVDRCRILNFEDLVFEGGEISKELYNFQIGASEFVKIKNIISRKYSGGIQFTRANEGTGFVGQTILSTNIEIDNYIVESVSDSVQNLPIRNALYFAQGNDWNIKVRNCDFSKFKYPISFNTTGVHRNIDFINCDLRGANGGSSMILNNTATIDDSIRFINCQLNGNTGNATIINYT
jgi:hypothetical protein